MTTITIASKFDENQSIGTALTSGLKGMWHFDEGTGASAYDASGNGNTGTLVSSPTWITGKFGKALSFRGTSQKVTPATPLGYSGYTTVSLWYYRDDDYGGTTGNWRTVLGAASNIHPLILNGGASYTLGIWYSGFYDFGWIPPNHEWHNLVIIYESGTSATLYVDGSFVSTVLPALDLSSTPILAIGNRGDDGDYWSGGVDEVRVYNRALSTAEITQLYTEGAPAVIIGNTTDIVDIVPLNGSVGIWHFDEGTGTTVYDASPYAYTGLLQNSPPWVAGKFGTALQFTAGASQRIATINPVLGLTNAFTYSAWVCPTAAPTSTHDIVGLAGYNPHWGYTLSISPSGGNMYMSLHYQDSGASWQVNNSSAFAYSLNTWMHFAVTYDGAYFKFYLNGTFLNQVANANTQDPVTVDELCIGIVGWDSPSAIIDEVRVYNRTLSATEITQLANEGAQSGDFVVESYVDLANMVSGDGTTITEYISADGVNLKTYKQDILSGAPSFSVYRFHSKLTNKNQLYRITLDQTAGTGKSYPVTSIMQVMSS
jgi:hypothetical protein